MCGVKWVVMCVWCKMGSGVCDVNQVVWCKMGNDVCVV